MIFFRMLVIASTLSASRLHAQDQPCKDIAARVSNGRTVSGDLSALLSCEAERSPALAAAVRRMAGATDVGELRDVTFAASLLVDAEVNSALQTLATTGSPQARAFVMCALAGHEVGAPTITFARQGTPDGGFSCTALEAEKRRQLQGRPLPVAHRELVHRLAQAILEDASTPVEIRPVAQFLAGVSAPLQPVQSEAPPPESAKIRLEYNCGNRFWVRNGNSSPVQVTYEVEGTHERATLSVPKAVRGTDYSEFGLRTMTKGTVRLLFNNNVIQVAANGDRACQS